MTDRRTDGRIDIIFIARPRLHFIQRGNNVDAVNNLVLSQEYTPQTHRTGRENLVIS